MTAYCIDSQTMMRPANGRNQNILNAISATMMSIVRRPVADRITWWIEYLVDGGDGKSMFLAPGNFTLVKVKCGQTFGHCFTVDLTDFRIVSFRTDSLRWQNKFPLVGNILSRTLVGTDALSCVDVDWTKIFALLMRLACLNDASTMIDAMAFVMRWLWLHILQTIERYSTRYTRFGAVRLTPIRNEPPD